MLREEAIEKIRKLLALADGNANENEALAAALKAQKLMAEFDVQAGEISGGGPQGDPVEVPTEPFVRGEWRNWLAKAIADNFRCKCYMHWNRLRPGTIKWQPTFVGYEFDARAAAMTYEKLAEVGERLVREECSRYRRLHGSAAGVKNSFLNGFVEGVRAELEKQCQALMLVTPKAVLDFFNGLDLSDGRPRTYKFLPDATDAGSRAGRDAVRAGRMDSPGEHMLTSA